MIPTADARHRRRAPDAGSGLPRLRPGGRLAQLVADDHPAAVAYSVAVENFLTAKPGSLQFEMNLAIMNAAERALDLQDCLCDDALELAEIAACLDAVTCALRGRVPAKRLTATLAAVEAALQ